MKKIDLFVLDSTAFDIEEDAKGLHFSIGEIRAMLPPHSTSKQLSSHQVISFLLTIWMTFLLT